MKDSVKDSVKTPAYATDPLVNGNSISQPIVGFRIDDQGHWIAELACGHNQHVRHDPPLVRRDWVKSPAGRDSMRGFHLACRKCVEGAPADDAKSESE